MRFADSISNADLKSASEGPLHLPSFNKNGIFSKLATRKAINRKNGAAGKKGKEGGKGGKELGFLGGGAAWKGGKWGNLGGVEVGDKSKGYSKNGRKLGRPPGSKNKIKNKPPKNL